jgi:hypothetical protein
MLGASMGDGESAAILFMAVCSAIWAWAAWRWTRSIAFAVVGAVAAQAAFFLIAPETGILIFVGVVALIAGFIHGGSRNAGRLRRLAGYALLAIGVAAPIAETIYVGLAFGAFCDRNSGTKILRRVDNVTAFADERGDGLRICHYCAAPLYRYVDVLVTDRWLNSDRSRINADKDGFYRLTGGKKGDAGCASEEMPYWNESLKGRCLISAKIERSDAPYRIRTESHEHKTSVGLVKEQREVYSSADGRTIVATYGAFERDVGQMWFERLEMAFRGGHYKRWSKLCPYRRDQPQLMIDKIFPPAR